MVYVSGKEKEEELREGARRWCGCDADAGTSMAVEGEEVDPGEKYMPLRGQRHKKG